FKVNSVNRVKSRIVERFNQTQKNCRTRTSGCRRGTQIRNAQRPSRIRDPEECEPTKRRLLNGDDQSFVLIPQARARHQPRPASKITNKPSATRVRQIQSSKSAMMIPAIRRIAPKTPRTIRPWKLMLRLKKR